MKFKRPEKNETGKSETDEPGTRVAGTPTASQVIIQTNSGSIRKWVTRILFLALLGSIVFNFVMYNSYEEYYAAADPPAERFHSGEKSAASKIVRISITGTIMPPFTSRTLKAIKRAKEDESVKGVLLIVDSPGGFVADSQQIFHELQKLKEIKPVVVQMRRMAASGGYYVSMGIGETGRIFAEPTCWTGSIGVIIPRYNVGELAEKIGVKSEPLKTGPYKDSLSPFRALNPDEEVLWGEILADSFDRFIKVIADNRAELDETKVRALATGQIYTANQALTNGMIDEIGYEEEALIWLKSKLELDAVRVVEYNFPGSILDSLLGSVEAQEPNARWHAVLEASVPREMYYFSWGLGLPAAAVKQLIP